MKFLLSLFFLGCNGLGNPLDTFSECRWEEVELLEIDWQEGETCRGYCSSLPFKMSPADPSDPYYVSNSCLTFDCFFFERDKDTHVQVWKDPFSGPAAQLGPEDWWTKSCRYDENEDGT